MSNRAGKEFPVPAVGDIVTILAVDWAIQTDEVDRDGDWGPTHGRIYGEVIHVDGGSVTVAAIAFEGDTVRCVLSVPWGTVLGLRILGRVGAW